MLKNILKLEGAQKLTNNEQKSINGGRAFLEAEGSCKKCCWAGTNNCSSGVEGGTSCVSGAELRDC